MDYRYHHYWLVSLQLIKSFSMYLLMKYILAMIIWYIFILASISIFMLINMFLFLLLLHCMPCSTFLSQLSCENHLVLWFLFPLLYLFYIFFILNDSDHFEMIKNVSFIAFFNVTISRKCLFITILVHGFHHSLERALFLANTIIFQRNTNHIQASCCFLLILCIFYFVLFNLLQSQVTGWFPLSILSLSDRRQM